MYSVSWYHKPDVVYLYFSGQLSIEELAACCEELFALTQNATEVYTIIDLHALTSFPRALDLIWGAIMHTATPYPRNVRAMICVGFENPVSRLQASVFARLSNVQIVHVDTVRQAEQQLALMDRGLQTAFKTG